MCGLNIKWISSDPAARYNDPHNLTVVNVGPGEKQTVPVVPSGRYCIMELPMGDNFHSESRYAREFIAEEDAR